MKAKINQPPSTGELRNFGLIFGAFIPLVFGLVLPFLFSGAYRLWPWVVGAVFVVWALLHPASLALVHKTWMRIGLVLNYINTRIILGIVFYLLLFPLGGIMRLFGWDAMHRKFSSEAESYRINSQQRDKTHITRPY